jgi:hypothetical protein
MRCKLGMAGTGAVLLLGGIIADIVLGLLTF